MRRRAAGVKATLAPGAPRAYLTTSQTRKVAAMSTGPSRILDDFARLLTDAAGAAQGVRRELENGVKAQLERLLNSMDLVQREEFEAVKEMAARARAENEALSARLAALEAGTAGETAQPKAKAKK